jgi:glycosyltransferase involved in cell wall biosynthesis
MTEPSAKPNIAIVCDTVPYPARSGDNQRLAELIAILRQNGWFVHLVLAALLDRQQRQICLRYVDALHLFDGTGWKTRCRNLLRRTVRALDRVGKRIGLPPAEEIASRGFGRKIAPLFIDYWQRCPQGLSDFVKKLAQRGQWRAIIVQYVWLHPSIGKLPNGITKLLDTHDIQHVRAQEFASRGMTFPLKITREEEQRIFNQFDAVIAIQSAEGSLIRGMCPRLRVLTVGTMGAAQRRVASRPIPGRVLYVGGYNGANIDGLHRFLTRIWPCIIDRYEYARLHVCGYIYRAFLSEEFKGVCFLGHNEDIEDQYAEAALVINPSWIGTGLKIKTIDALARGKPLVTTPKGVEGLNGAIESACVICKDDLSFVQGVVDLLMSPNKRNDLGEAASVYAQKHLTAGAVYGELLAFLNHFQ